MEVVAIFSSEKDLVNLLYTFTNSYQKLYLSGKDNDTAYFSNRNTGRHEFYFHFELDNVEHELSYNFSEEDVQKIRNYFSAYAIYLFYISYRDNQFLQEFFQAFVNELERQNEFAKTKILIHHPFDGLVPI